MKYGKKTLALLLALALGLGTLSGCGSTNESNDTTTDTQSTTAVADDSANTAADQDTSAEPLSLKFGVTPGTIRTALVLLADHLGYYEEEGLDLSLVEVSDATAALTSISTNKDDIDIWGTGIVPDLNFIANGSDLVIFSGTAAEGGAIIAKPENVDRFKDFDNYRDITIATVRADTAWVVSRGYLKDYGIDVDNEINVIEVDSQVNVAEAVIKGEADLGFLPAEFATKYADNGVETVYEVGELEPLYVCCRQVVSRKTLEDNYDALVAFTVANLRAYAYYNDEANRDDIVSYLAEYSDQTEEYVNQYLFENRTIMTLDPNQQGIISYYNSLVDAGYFTGDIDIADHIDTSVYQDALNQILEREPDNQIYQELLTTYQANNL